MIKLENARLSANYKTARLIPLKPKVMGIEAGLVGDNSWEVYLMMIKELEGDIWQFDLVDCGVEGRTCGYLVKGEKGWLLLETGPASSLPQIVAAIDNLDIGKDELIYIGVTHIHVDHAGGLGATAEHFPEAKILVHHRGARHVIDPSRLIKGATAVWGAEKMAIFGPILPVDQERVIPVQEGDEIDLGNRLLTVWDTPGHARHHVCFHDNKTNGLFTGDAAGVYQPHLSEKLGRYVIRTATPPPDFDEEAMMDTLKRMAMAELDILYFTHFGPLKQPLQVIEQLIGQLTLQMELARQYKGHPQSRELLGKAMVDYIMRELGVRDINDIGTETDEIIKNEWSFMTGLLELSGAGCLHYLGDKVSGSIG